MLEVRGQSVEHTERERFEGATARLGGAPRAAAAVLLGVVMGVVSILGAAPSADWRGGALWAGLWLVGSALFFPRMYRRLRAGRIVEVGAEGLFVEGKLLVPRAEAARALLAERGDGARVTIKRSAGDDVIINTATAEQGQRLLDALQWKPGSRAVVFTIDDSGIAFQLVALIPSMTFAAIFLFILLRWQPHFDSPTAYSLPGFAVPLLHAAASRLFRSTVTIGTDGILAKSLVRQQFVRFSDIKRTETRGKQLWIHLADGRSLRLSAKTTLTVDAGASTPGSLRWMEERLREMLAASGGQQAAPLGPRNTPPQDWVRSLRGALGKGVAGFRDQALLPEQLWHALENARLSATARAAAAIALGSSLDEAGKDRLRVATETIADPKLRVLLQAAVGSDEEKIVNALGEVEAMEAQARQKETRAT